MRKNYHNCIQQLFTIGANMGDKQKAKNTTITINLRTQATRAYIHKEGQKLQKNDYL